MQGEQLSLIQLEIRNYKNLQTKKGVRLHPLNILIGPNGSGKSNFLALFRFVKNCVVLSPAENRGVSSFEEAIAFLGGVRLLDASLEGPSIVPLSFRFSQGVQFELELYVDIRNNQLKIHKEALSDYSYSPKEPFLFYQCHNPEMGKGDFSISDDPTKKDSFEQIENLPTNQVILNKLPEIITLPPQSPLFQKRRQILDHISGWRFYNASDMNLRNIRNSEPKIGAKELFLSDSGENLPLVLENLIQENLDFEETLNAAMRAILPTTKKVRPSRSGRLGITIEWHMEGISERFYLNEMSDGSVRMLCWATVLLSPFLPSLLVLDEPELGLHPAWMSILAEWIKQAGQKTQVIICTHSPDLLDHLTDLLDQVHCFQYQDQSHFLITPLSRVSLQEKLGQNWQLGDLYRVGDPGVGGWPW